MLSNSVRWLIIYITPYRLLGPSAFDSSLAVGWPLNSDIADKRMGVLNELIGGRGKTNASIYSQTG
jgi:hypothetical protein